MKSFVIAAIAISTLVTAARADGAALGGLFASAGVNAAALAAAVPAPSQAAPARPGIQLGDTADLTPAQADALAAAETAAGAKVFQLDGTRMTTKPALLAYSAQALGLPADMDNWDAMIDYLGELPDYNSASELVIIVRDASAIQAADPALYAGLREVAVNSCQRVRYGNRGAALKFVFVK